jgi:hypothetical protein
MTADSLEQLIADWLQGTISPDDFRALDRRLRDDPAARRALRRAANLDSALRDWATREASAAAWLDTGPAPAPAAPVVRGPWRRWRLPVGLAAAAALCVAAYRFGGHTAALPAAAPVAVAEQTDRGAAILTQAVDAAWLGDGGRTRLGDSLAVGPRTLGSGFAQIEFFSGAALLVEGPAEFEIVSPWQVVWRHGKARVRVPPAARGFEVLTPGMKLVDLGTEFGVEVDRATTGARVQVFSGEVEAHPHAAAQFTLTEGQGLEQRGAAVARVAAIAADAFLSGDRMRDLGRARADSRFERWEAFSRAQRRDPRLLAYYALQRDAAVDRLVRNRAEPGDALRDGGAVGATWTEGRWPRKDALEFKRPGDRVRLDLAGTYDALTFAGWVKVDGLDRKYNSLLLTDGYENGEPHWQIYEDGRLMFSLKYPDPADPSQARNAIYYSPIVFDRANTGRWHHVAVTYENRSGTVVHYVDGAEISRETDPLHRPGRPIVYGPSELGNWGLPTLGHRFPIRNLNGRIDEFAIYASALSAGEIRAMFEAGRPE